MFIVNTEDELDKKKDEAWVFQPKMSVMDPADPPRAIFVQRRNWTADLTKLDPLTRDETETLEMLYRRHLEFAVGHGVSVHVLRSGSDGERAMRIETTFMPHAKVEQQTARTPEDEEDLRGVSLDMRQLSEVSKPELLASLRSLENAYRKWIENEAGKIGDRREGLAQHEAAAKRAIQKCERTCNRIREGIELIDSNSVAEEAFRFANRAMWQQRVHSTYARSVRKKEIKVGALIDAFDVSDNRSWRLFQLAFVLLNLPSISRFDHPDGSHETEAVADLLWFATGGGKTEAYLGLTAYTLALRRLQGEIEGRSGDHGVAVLMRYTLRLLTLQQFQRAAALLCACEVIRREDTKKWGDTPFRLGLWVGRNTTTNTLAKAAEGLRQGRLRWPPTVRGTPHQITSWPPGGTDISSAGLRG